MKWLSCRQTVVFWISVVCGFPGSFASSAENAASRARAVSAIFADDHIKESVLMITERAAAMTDQDRYAFLSRWVLPNDLHESLRVQIDFTPTQPAPPVDRETPRAGRRMNAGGRVISPVLDLVHIAGKVGKLEEIQEQVERCPVTTPLDQKNRLALLSVIQLRHKKLDDALVHIDEFCQLSALEQPDDELYRASEVILFVSSLPFSDVCDVVRPTIDRVINRHRAKFLRSSWSRQFRSLPSLQSEINADDSAVATSPQWGSFSTISAETRGVGIPGSRWILKKGRAENTASHGDDYLFFAIPMRGNYQIECDVTAFNWSETRLLVGGKWVSPGDDYTHYTVGNMRNEQVEGAIIPQLAKGGETLHYRTEVRNGSAKTFAEGRLIHSEQLSEDHDPWIAIRNGDSQEGSAFNVRVTGTPEIPQSILLTSASSLASWLPYYGDTAAQWQEVPSGGIRGLSDYSNGDIAIEQRQPKLTGAEMHAGATYHEQAIFYQRPMLEDGTIEYEFFYSEGKQTAHPMLDRLCFVMAADGVKIHWLTDGQFDRTALSPDNFVVEADNRRGPALLPLKENQWNHVRVDLSGDAVDIVLNDQLVYQRTLESTNQRHFGFSYYSDQAELNVRDVKWTGKWPQGLMPVKDQELSSEDPVFLDQKSEHLTSYFEHDFVRDGLSKDRISAIKGSGQEALRVTSKGLLAIRSGNPGYQNTAVTPNLQVQGDFDITVAYEDFQSSPTVGGSSSLMLMVILDNTTADEYFVTRRHMINDRGGVEQFVQCATVQKFAAGEKQDYFFTGVMEDRSGRLRLARRGKMMYYLTAEGDSPNFRLRASRETSNDPIAMQGIRLINQMHQNGSSSVIWKSIEVRAEDFSGTASGKPDPRLTQLNEEREKLPIAAVYDFTKESPDPSVLYRWGDRRDWSSTHKGLRIQAEGFDTWESAGIRALHSISGDFDITTKFEVVSMAEPRADDQTAVFLQLEATDQQGSQFNCVFNLEDSGFKEAVCQLRTTSEEGEHNYRDVGNFSTTAVNSLRMTRRGNRWTALARVEGSGEDRIIGEADVTDMPISRARLLLHTGGKNRTSEILLVKFEIRAATFAPAGNSSGAPSPRKGTVESLLDLFK